MSREQCPIRIQTIFYREVGPSYRIEPHSINVWQWYYVLHGNVISIVDGERFELHPDDSMILRPGMVRDRTYGGKAPGYMVVEFENMSLDVANAAQRVLQLPPALRDDLHALVGEIRAPVGRNSRELVNSLVVRLLVGLVRDLGDGETMVSSTTAISDTHHRAMVDRADRFMSHNLGNPLKRADIAKAIGVSEVHMARVYRSVTGMTPGTRLRQLRIELARELLLETTIPITNIAMEVGFDSFSHFAATFRRLVGVAPSDYRRSGGKAWSHPAPASAAEAGH